LVEFEVEPQDEIVDAGDMLAKDEGSDSMMTSQSLM
jgi:hypothetical protein